MGQGLLLQAIGYCTLERQEVRFRYKHNKKDEQDSAKLLRLY